jgi:hypothetical protein
MGGINALVDDVICSGTILSFEVSVMMKYNALSILLYIIRLTIQNRVYKVIIITPSILY